MILSFLTMLVAATVSGAELRGSIPPPPEPSHPDIDDHHRALQDGSIRRGIQAATSSWAVKESHGNGCSSRHIKTAWRYVHNPSRSVVMRVDDELLVVEGPGRKQFSFGDCSIVMLWDGLTGTFLGKWNANHGKIQPNGYGVPVYLDLNMKGNEPLDGDITVWRDNGDNWPKLGASS